jgi:hypothetical protein
MSDTYSAVSLLNATWEKFAKDRGWSSNSNYNDDITCGIYHREFEEFLFENGASVKTIDVYGRKVAWIVFNDNDMMLQFVLKYL